MSGRVILAGTVQQERGVFPALAAKRDRLAGAARAASHVEARHGAQQIVEIGRAPQVERFRVDGSCHAGINEGVQLRVGRFDHDDIGIVIRCVRILGQARNGEGKRGDAGSNTVFISMSLSANDCQLPVFCPLLFEIASENSS